MAKSAFSIVRSASSSPTTMTASLTAVSLSSNSKQRRKGSPIPQGGRRNVTLSATGLIVAALFVNAMIVHIRVFSHRDASMLEGDPSIVTNSLQDEQRLLTVAAQTKPHGLSHNTFSACMLIKDDNDLLNEWLAYHYHVLNLRYLLVAVDPSSATSPTPIFDKWRRLTDLKIVEWSDPNFMPKVFLLTGYHISPNLIDGDASKSKWHEGHEDAEKVKADNLQITNHRFRQVTFLAACLKHMRNHKKTWTMHVDTDEFVVVNPLLRNTTRANVQMVKIPKIQEKGSMLKVIQQFYQDNTLRQKYNYPCISMPRLLFGSVEFTDNATLPLDMPDYLDSSKLETIRWQYHTHYDDIERNAQPKVIVDVSVVDPSNDMFHKPFSIHRPSKYLCRRIDQLDFQQLQRYPITVNHYTGSWERYFNKNDTRRSERAYNSKAYVAEGHDSWMTPWLSGFVKNVGPERAKELLNDYVTLEELRMETA